MEFSASAASTLYNVCNRAHLEYLTPFILLNCGRKLLFALLFHRILLRELNFYYFFILRWNYSIVNIRIFFVFVRSWYLLMTYIDTFLRLSVRKRRSPCYYRDIILLTVVDMSFEMLQWTSYIALDMTNLMVNWRGVSRFRFWWKTNHTDSRSFGKDTPVWKTLPIHIITRLTDHIRFELVIRFISH
jgi:hypothetical protein